MKRYLRVFLLVGVLLTASALPASAAGHKTVVCHKGKNISVATSSVSAHIAHGDPVDSDGSPVPCS